MADLAYRSPLFSQSGGKQLAYRTQTGEYSPVSAGQIPSYVDLKQPVYQMPAKAFNQLGTMEYGGGPTTKTPTSYSGSAGTLREGQVYLQKKRPEGQT